MDFRVFLEILRAVLTLAVLGLLIVGGKPLAVSRRKGYKYITIGFALLAFASILDITDNFHSLSRYYIIGDTDTQAVLEKIVGYLGGFIMITLGFWKWLPEVSELQQAKKDLKESLEREKSLKQEVQQEKYQLSVTLNSIADGVIRTDIEGRIVFMNPAAENLTGWIGADAEGKTITEVFRLDAEGKVHRNPVEKVLKTGETVSDIEYAELFSRHGKSVDIADAAAPVRNSDGTIIGVVLVFRDVTAEKKILEENIRLQKLESMGLLAGGIAHDFNNLIMGIQGNIHLAIASDKLDEESLELLKDADKATRRARELTKQLLAFSKGGKPDIHHAAIGELVREAAKFLLSGSKVKCSVDIEDDINHALVDTAQIGQVIENIIINARQAMPGGGSMKIEMFNVPENEIPLLGAQGEYDNFICVRVADTGPGIRKDIIDKVFEPYFSTKPEGSGLGLATSFAIINKHNGTIHVESEEGKGTVFSIYLPAADVPEDEREANLPHEAGVFGRIIIMDDEPLIRKLLSSMLEKFGFEVIQAEEGKNVIAAYQRALKQKKTVDLVMLDLTIPGGMGGEETAEQLLKIDKNVRMIVVSGYTDNHVLTNYAEYGFTAALAKPFTNDDLEKVLTSVGAL